MKGINTLRYSDIFLAMYSDNGSSCLHRNMRKSPDCTRGIVRLSARISVCSSLSKHTKRSSSKPYS